MEPSAHIDTFARDNLPPPDQWPELLLDGLWRQDEPDRTDGTALCYPPRFNCAAELLDRAIEAGYGERPAIWSDIDGVPHATSYRALRARVDQTAHVLVEDMRLQAGNRVLLRGPNTLHMAVAWLACVKAGLVVVATMPQLRAQELKQIIDKAHISAALCDARLAEELAWCATPGHESFCATLAQIRLFGHDAADALDALASGKPSHFTACDTAADDVCLIAFTSGTTGVPKGCMHFHRDVLAMCDLFPREVLKPTPSDVFCGTPPLAFTFGLGGLLCFPLRAGASSVLIERPTPETLLRTVERFRATIMFTAPTCYRQMAAALNAAGFDLSSLRKTVSAGEMLSDATRELWRQATGIDMIDGLGSTELLHIFASSTGPDHRRHAIGRAVRGYVIAVVDENMRPVPAGSIGRLAVKGPIGCRYLRDARQRNAVRDGWNLTGDTVYADEDGYLFYHGRADDMIVSSGYNISGPEIEGTLNAHDAVAECCVVGVADDERGQIVKAFVVVAAGHRPSGALAVELQAFVKCTIAPYKCPRSIEFVEALPRTETGKLKRHALRDGDRTALSALSLRNG
jgi:2-aminobenzoate-CoA ligase